MCSSDLCEDYHRSRLLGARGVAARQVTIANEQSTINAMMLWLFRQGDSRIDGFDFPRMPRLDRNDESVRRSTFEAEEVVRFGAPCTAAPVEQIAPAKEVAPVAASAPGEIAPVETGPVEPPAPIASVEVAETVEPVAPVATVAPMTEKPAPAAERQNPLRFVWQMDAEENFTLASDDFVELIGPVTAQIIGKPWKIINATLQLDADDQVARAVATRDTWSGVTVQWPVDDSERRLKIELSGLPIYDRQRAFTGYRGFGVCRDIEAFAAIEIGRAHV